MTEDFLHFIWQNKLYEPITETCKGQNIEILNPGLHNNDAGPDFSNSLVVIDGVKWAGNVEIHIKSSDWKRHNHQQNPNYHNVILHVVFHNDTTITLPNGRELPQVILKFSENLYEKYIEWNSAKNQIPCHNDVVDVNSFFLSTWLHRMLIERLENKIIVINSMFLANNKSYEQTLFQLIAHYLGPKINALPFENLARSIPLNLIAKHKNSLLQIEALCFGQAGFLSQKDINHPYFIKLQSEYQFLQNKFRLKPMDLSIWKFSRLRPSNFPTIRIAQLAMLIYKSTHLFSKTMKADSVAQIKSFFNITASSFWTTHYQFHKESISRDKNLGESAINTIIINALLPLMFFSAKQNGNQELMQKAIEFYETLPAEKNNIVQKWKNIELKINSAYQSQAFIQLKSNYCDKYKCLDCELGNRILRKYK